MPAIREAFDINPVTGEKGFWIEPSGSAPDTFIGISDAEIKKLEPSADVIAAMQKYVADVSSSLQAVVDKDHPMGRGAVVIEVSTRISDKGEISHEFTVSNPG